MEILTGLLTDDGTASCVSIPLRYPGYAVGGGGGVGNHGDSDRTLD